VVSLFLSLRVRAPSVLYGANDPCLVYVPAQTDNITCEDVVELLIKPLTRAQTDHSDRAALKAAKLAVSQSPTPIGVGSRGRGGGQLMRGGASQLSQLSQLSHRPLQVRGAARRGQVNAKSTSCAWVELSKEQHAKDRSMATTHDMPLVGPAKR
jgi:hypothetical protein